MTQFQNTRTQNGVSLNSHLTGKDSLVTLEITTVTWSRSSWAFRAHTDARPNTSTILWDLQQSLGEPALVVMLLFFLLLFLLLLLLMFLLLLLLFLFLFLFLFLMLLLLLLLFLFLFLFLLLLLLLLLPLLLSLPIAHELVIYHFHLDKTVTTWSRTCIWHRLTERGRKAVHLRFAERKGKESDDFAYDFLGEKALLHYHYIPIESMGLVYLPTFTTKNKQM